MLLDSDVHAATAGRLVQHGGVGCGGGVRVQDQGGTQAVVEVVGQDRLGFSGVLGNGTAHLKDHVACELQQALDVDVGKAAGVGQLEAGQHTRHASRPEALAAADVGLGVDD